MDFEQFKFLKTNQLPQKIELKSTSPSNIALVKYWGKADIQIPKNTSISFTLSNCYTATQLQLVAKTKVEEKTQIKVELDGVSTPSFHPKIEKFLKLIEEYCPYVNHYHFSIQTQNTFPHSSGIASSASGMSALAMCLMQLEKKIDPEVSHDFILKKASFLARLGSGSASRSIQGKLMLWGKHAQVNESSDLYAIALKQDLHPIFKDYQDSILLVDKGQKKVSSTLGHSLMNGHPFAEKRFEQAQHNCSDLLEILKSGNLEAFMTLVESEALTLHAMMMSSRPYFMLMTTNTLAVLNAIWEFRKTTRIPVCFTLDAGANVHLLYPKQHQKNVVHFIDQSLKQYCENQQVIHDEVGKGAEIIE
ncbi:diphosphomevalonate/mevalonate 3,5-bisphosphate decarboxylase family protein [Psychroflexus salis]|uniref:Diphosphomevalonate decarboxylase n=1 Tax=Psychroflexus salis TaxID=1526574 RepID=A0A916ZM97_9FLAO|nr:diphosphomevalonate decarboxylase [Psychroflexus salis]GGE04509.1 diphosphomevalonate decarboxylase [Psychroflexus salis]